MLATNDLVEVFVGVGFCDNNAEMKHNVMIEGHVLDILHSVHCVEDYMDE